MFATTNFLYDKKVVVSSSPIRIRVCQQVYSEKLGRCSLSEILAISCNNVDVEDTVR